MPVELKRTGWRVCSPGMARYGVPTLVLACLLAACSSPEPPCQKKVTAVVTFLGSACGSVEVVCDGKPVDLTTGGLGRAICADYVCGVINETETVTLTFDWTGGACEIRSTWDVLGGLEPFIRPLVPSCEPETFEFTAGEEHPCEGDVVSALDSQGAADNLSEGVVHDVEPEAIPDSIGDDLGDLFCEPPMPYIHDGTCVECLTSAHCGPWEICNQATWACETPNICDLECCYCQAPYESCIQSWGVWMCLECPDDLACGPGGTCDPVTFTCSGAFPEPWCPDCVTDEDCWDVVTNLDLACDPATGCCFDQIGRCNNFSAMCISEVGSGCVGLHAVSTGPPPDDPPQSAACTCSTPWSGDPLACWPDGCPDDGCLGATVCASAELASAAGLPLAYEGGLCLDIHLFVSEPEPDFGSSE